MKNFVKLYKKSFSEQPNKDDFLNAAKDLYNILLLDSLAKGEDWSTEPKFICHLKDFMPLPGKRDKSLTYRDYLEKAFEKETGIAWDHEKYVLIHVPTQIIGSRHFVVFQK